jgi:hypothetical protein
MRFYSNAIGNDDQLRQRVAFALSQIVVASDLEVHTTAGLATFNQILLTTPSATTATSWRRSP